MMSYDFHGPFKSWINPYDYVTGFNAALHSDPKDKENQIVKENFNVAAAVQNLLKEGFPKSKINAGLAFYGRGYGGVEGNATNNGLYANYTSVPGAGTWDHGVFDYWDLKENYVSKNGFTKFTDETSGVPWLFNAESKVMISYDDNASIALKAQYILDQDLGGAMFWEFSGDKHNDLIESVYSTFKNHESI